ncbi:methyltransferase [Thioalkalivibrio paradoxus]|nr:methyltransferase [Thioalkalivibrio paradoxus]
MSTPNPSTAPIAPPGRLSRLWRHAERIWSTRVMEGLLLRRHAQHMYLLMGGHIYFQTVCAGVQTGLFRLLDREPGLTLAEIAERLGLEEKPTRILLLGCTSLGLLRKRRHRYRNGYLASRLLVDGVPGNVVPILRWQQEINYRALAHFPDALAANTNVGLEEFPGSEPTLYERLAHDARLETIFQEAMESISVQANQLLARFGDFSSVRHLVDVGGGNGTNILELARQHPYLQGTVFDLPSVCTIAQRNFQQGPHADRLGTHAGNCFTDPFPEGADAFLFCHFLTIWSEAENRRLLEKAFQALPSGGQVMIFNMMQADDGRGPLSAALGSPYFLTLATGRGMLYTWSEYEHWVRDAGFQSVSRLRLPRDHGLIVGRKSG